MAGIFGLGGVCVISGCVKLGEWLVGRWIIVGIGIVSLRRFSLKLAQCGDCNVDGNLMRLLVEEMCRQS